MRIRRLNNSAGKSTILKPMCSHKRRGKITKWHLRPNHPPEAPLLDAVEVEHRFAGPGLSRFYPNVKA